MAVSPHIQSLSSQVHAHPDSYPSRKSASLGKCSESHRIVPPVPQPMSMTRSDTAGVCRLRLCRSRLRYLNSRKLEHLPRQRKSARSAETALICIHFCTSPFCASIICLFPSETSSMHRTESSSRLYTHTGCTGAGARYRDFRHPETPWM